MAALCRLCRAPLAETVVDLGLSPVSNEFRAAATVDSAPQSFYPLKVMVCGRCWLVQTLDVPTPPHFGAHYAYFSSVSTSWLAHSEAFARRMTGELKLGPTSRVVEIASNDGYLLRTFKDAGVPVLGIDPSANVAEAARARHGIETRVEFFGTDSAARLVAEGIRADLLIANNVLAHVPDLNDFVAGMAMLLKPAGTITLEFPHLLRLLDLNQFDTIYHEHFSYLSLGVVERLFRAHGLAVSDVEEISTHGGSLRVHARHASEAARAVASETLDKVRRDETEAGLEGFTIYRRFAGSAADCKAELLGFFVEARRAGKTVLGYGAPAKGNTLLNYCGVGPEFLPYTVDRSEWKQGMVLPGVNIPVRDPAALLADRPDYILILPWNLRGEITAQLAEVRSWGGRFVTAIPTLDVF